MTTSQLRVGRHSVAWDVAHKAVSDYIAPPAPGSRQRPFAFDVYDTYRAEERFEPLDEADLLAPVLLNVRHLRLDAYRWLVDQLKPLNAALEQINPEASLADENPDLAPLASLFSTLDDKSCQGVRLTILSKILHRKRPRFIPLWDTHVSACYSTGSGAPVTVVRTRSWSDYAVAIAKEMNKDLRNGQAGWKALSSLSAGQELTELRALDILAWTLR